MGRGKLVEGGAVVVKEHVNVWWGEGKMVAGAGRFVAAGSDS